MDGVMFAPMFAATFLMGVSAAPAAPVPQITAEPERHRICELALGMFEGQRQMGEYYCERDNHTLEILGAKDKRLDCKMPVMPAQTLTFFENGGAAWSVRCTEADRVKPPVGFGQNRELLDLHQ